jgi:FdhE protein
LFFLFLGFSFFFAFLCVSVVKSFLELPCAGPKPHNPPVTTSPWQQRIRRAEQLAAQHPFAAEILVFYIHLARFQEDLYNRLDRDPAKSSGARSSAGVPPAVESASRRLTSQLDARATKTLLSTFPEFLSLVEKRAPAPLSQVARDLHSSDPATWPDLFTQCFTHIDSPTDPQEFLILAFLQPYAEFTRLQAEVQPVSSPSFHCPFCHRKPALAILRPQGDGGRRSLLCGFCLTEWDFRRLICPGCGEENHAKLPVYTADNLPAIRVECCDTCQTYIKCIDLTKSGLAEPLIDELASVPLNLWAQEHGYAKLQPNLLGV